MEIEKPKIFLVECTEKQASVSSAADRTIAGLSRAKSRDCQFFSKTNLSQESLDCLNV